MHLYPNSSHTHGPSYLHTANVQRKHICTLTFVSYVLQVLSAVAFRYPDGLEDSDGPADEYPDGSANSDGTSEDGNAEARSSENPTKGMRTEAHVGSAKSIAAVSALVMSTANGVGVGSVAAYFLAQQLDAEEEPAAASLQQRQRHKLKVLASPFGGFVAALAAATAHDASLAGQPAEEASTTAVDQGEEPARPSALHHHPGVPASHLGADPSTAAAAAMPVKPAVLHPLGVPASTLAEIVDLVTAMVFPDALASPLPLSQVHVRYCSTQ